MVYCSTLTSKGQVTIPKDIRVRLGLHEGEQLEFVAEGGVTIIRPARIAENPFAKYVGVLKDFPGGAEEINRWVSELREDGE